ncbi:MAG TPA: MauE/DoxX family redox-associated membrane protein [Pyrinomonadaceae bacterium]|jgi:uncharacterized membrane protein YphA (DoxX/SURF4 family)
MDAETREHGDAESGFDSHVAERQSVSASPRHRVAASVLKWLVHICRFALAALFLFAAGAKLTILKQFVGNVAELLSSMHINYERWQWPATIAVIAAEIVAALLLLIPKTVRAGAAWAAVLLIGFSAFALYYTYGLHGEPLECNCFGGIIASQLGVSTALRNLVLLIPAVIVFFGARRIGQPQKGAKGTKGISV